METQVFDMREREFSNCKNGFYSKHFEILIWRLKTCLELFLNGLNYMENCIWVPNLSNVAEYTETFHFGNWGSKPLMTIADEGQGCITSKCH